MTSANSEITAGLSPTAAIEQLLAGDDLALADVETCMNGIMSGQWSEQHLTAFLIALRAKGESIQELAGCARVMRNHAGRINAPGAIDIVGTGGDGAHSVNISTAASFVVRGTGVAVAKHGNRSVSSKSGSADVLEALGAKVDLTVEQTQAVYDKTKFCFMYAPQFHASMRHVAPTRKALGLRTVFNLLGPLTNPAHVKVGVFGVYDRQWLESYAYVLKFLGVERAVVVHGEPGLDEAVADGITHVAELSDGDVRSYQLRPDDFGLSNPVVDASGGDADHNAHIIREILAGNAHPARDCILVNAALGLFVAGKAESVKQGYAMALTATTDGSASQALADYIAASQSV